MDTETSPAKAIVAATVAGAASLVATIGDKTSFGDLSPLQWVVCVLSAVVAGGGVYATPYYRRRR